MKDYRMPDGNEPQAFIFQIKDFDGEQFSPVFEQSSIGMAKRIFKIKTLKDVPEGIDLSSFELWLVGIRRNMDIELIRKLVMIGDKDE